MTIHLLLGKNQPTKRQRLVDATVNSLSTAPAPGIGESADIDEEQPPLPKHFHLNAPSPDIEESTDIGEEEQPPLPKRLCLTATPGIGESTEKQPPLPKRLHLSLSMNSSRQRTLAFGARTLGK